MDYDDIELNPYLRPAVPIGDTGISEKPGTRTGGWSQSTELAVGGQAVGGGQPGAAFQVDFFSPRDIRGRPAAVYTVTFNVDTTAMAGAGFQQVNPVATVTFSSEGNSYSRRFSLVNGMSISGPADHISVRVEDATQAPGGGPVPAPSGTYVVSMVVTPGSRTANVPPGLPGRFLPISLGAGASSEMLVPVASGVKTVRVLASATGGGIAVALMRDAIGTILAQWDPTVPIDVPILPQATDIRVTNVGVLGNVLFNMFFGVDG